MSGRIYSHWTLILHYTPLYIFCIRTVYYHYILYYTYIRSMFILYIDWTPAVRIMRLWGHGVETVYRVYIYVYIIWAIYVRASGIHSKGLYAREYYQDAHKLSKYECVRRLLYSIYFIANFIPIVCIYTNAYNIYIYVLYTQRYTLNTI